MKKVLILFILVLAIAKFGYCTDNQSIEIKNNQTASDKKTEKDNDSSLQSKDKPDNEVVVIATRLATPTKEIGSSVSVIDSKQIEQKKKSFVTELLSGEPGINVVSSGGAGQPASVFIRGAKSEHTLVLLDGIELNDPFNPGRTFDFGQLETTNIDRIEVIRGSQSTLYGSDAIGGVVNIRTKKGSGKPKFYGFSEMGSFETFREGGGVSGGTDLYNYSFGVSRTDSKGFSAATHTKGNREEDGYKNTTLSTRFGVTPLDCLEFTNIIRYTDSEFELDDSGGRGGDDPNYYSYIKQYFMRNEGKLLLFDDMYEQIFGFSLSNYNRDLRDKSDPIDIYFSKYSYDSKIYKFDYQHNLYFPEFKVFDQKINNIFTAGLEHEKEAGRSKSMYDSFDWWTFSKVLSSSVTPRQEARIDSLFLQDKISIADTVFTTFGARWDEHSQFGTHPTIRIVPSVFVNQTGTKLKVSYGNGFKAPTLYQLFSDYGNRNLQPEESDSWETGFEQFFCNNKISFGTTYFQNNLKNLIDYDFGTSKYTNIAEATTKGIEFFANYNMITNLDLGFNYTYLNTKDLATRQNLLRRPKNSIGINTNYRFFDDKANINCEIKYVGGSFDNDFSTWPATRVRLKGYTLVNVTAKYAVTKNVEVFGKINNLLDNYYETVYGYENQPFSIYGGVKVEL